MTAGRVYRRRRRTPIAVVVSLLAVLTVVTWTVVLVGAGGAAGPVACPAPAAGPPPGEVLDAAALDGVAPIPPSAVRVTVLNAGGQRGQANLVAAQLADLGFAEAAPPANDTFYPEGEMECVGQLRFGPAGEPAASTLALVLPCAELVRDARDDDSVDATVGTGFLDVNPNRQVSDALEDLDNPGGGGDGSANTGDAAAAAPALGADVLAQARDVTC